MLNKLRCLFYTLAILLPAAPLSAQDVEIQTVTFGEGSHESWLVEDHELPLAHIKLAFRHAGSVSDPKDQQGRAQMVAALLTEGAGDMNALEFNQTLESYAIKMAFSVDEDMLTAEVQTLSENVDKAFELLALALTRPQLDETAITRVKAQMHTSLRLQEQQPDYVASRALRQQVFAGHPYANSVQGTHEGIDSLTKTSLEDYLHHYISRDNLFMSVVGDVHTAQLQALIDHHFSGLQAEFAPEAEITTPTLRIAGQTEVVRRSIPQTVILFAGEGLSRDDPDFYAAYVLNHLLGGGGLTSRLSDEIREKRGLAYYAYSYLQILDHAALFTGGFGTRNTQASEAMKVLMDTLRQVQAGTISEDEINDAKSYITGAFPLALASGDKLADMLQVMQRFSLGKDYLQNRNAHIEAVTKEDIIRVAQRLIKPERLVIIGVGDPSQHLADFR